jgi:protein-S-isoprenylcysteine O-methyltransferase Ste14
MWFSTHLPPNLRRLRALVLAVAWAVLIIGFFAMPERIAGPGPPVAWLVLGGLVMVLFAGVIALAAVSLRRWSDAAAHLPEVAAGYPGGPYNVVRHPYEFGVIGVLAGWALVTGSLFVLMGVIGLAFLEDLRIRIEERWLAARHASFAAYMQRTRRLVPGLY